MDSNDTDRSGRQTAAELARLGNAAWRIAKAAATFGPEGAAMVAAQEAAPFVAKIAVGIVIALIVIPMLIFTAIPNIFFGYGTSDAEGVVRMTRQAASIGGVCMSLEEFEDTVIDAIVTSIANEYAEQGVAIDHIEVVSYFDEESLQWFTAINSAAHAQDLEEMSVDEIRELCAARLSYSLSLFGEEEITLRITIQKLVPDEWMEKLGFDDDARTWAGAIFETFSESDAMTKYAAYFTDTPDYSGDSGYTGGIQYGNSYGNDIDTSQFIDPSTKNAHDLAAYALQAWENNWGYVWGTFGNVLTPSLLEYKVKQYPDGVGKYESVIRERYLGRRTADCIGLVKSYGWFNPDTGGIDYGTNGVPDYSANQMYQNAVNRGTEHGMIANMPEIPGLILWKEGHTGVYIGGGYAIEAMSTSKGVGKTKVAGRGWQAWYKLPYIDYN